MRSYFLLFCCALVGFAQPAPDKETESLQRVLGEAGNSPVDFIRALEDHLNHFPNSPRKLELERALVKTAIDLKDTKRIIVFGERVLEVQPDDPALLQQVAIALVRDAGPPSRDAGAQNATKALEYSLRFENIERELAHSLQAQKLSGREAARRKDEVDKAVASALVLQSRAHGILQHKEKAAALAVASYKIYPSVEAAREASTWYAELGDNQHAIEYLANVFSIDQLRSADPQKAQDRIRMAELYRKMKGSDVGLGDAVLEAYDRTSADLANRRASLRALDPNSQVTDPFQFTLAALDSEPLKLASLLGKVVILDFWATWCGPCRAQHPLYEEVKKKFKDNPDVVFLSVDTDEDRAGVKAYVTENHWSQKVYFEDGLSSNLQVGSIPTTIIFNKQGGVASRMNGFLPERFVGMLTERIQDALGSRPAKPLESIVQ
jgi:thiol-disulfide isomerase/thioredoxin